ncbi:MAG: amidohydrolase family protein [bacterium]
MKSSKFPSLAVVLLAGLGLWGCEQPETAAPVDEYSLAITNVTALDAVNGARSGVTVLLRGDEIVSVAPSDQAPSNAAQVIDGSGQFLIPGLWDMHVHVTYEPRLTEQMPALFLDYGITSVRDTGGMLPALLPEVERYRGGEVQAPRIYFSGPLLDGSKVVYDGNDRPEIGIANATPEEARANVQTLVDAGADFIKIYELVSPEVFAALVEAAQQHNLPIASHVPLALLADNAGPQVGSMEHLRNVELACAEDADDLVAQRLQSLKEPGEQSGFALRSAMHAQYRPQALASIDIDSTRCQAVIRSLQNTIQVPTLRLNTLFRYSPLSRDDWREHLGKLPAPVATQWLQSAERFFGQGSADALKMSDWSLALVGQMFRSGVPIGAGTDTPIGQAIPGYSLHTELERLVQAGLSPLQALHAATIKPAEFLNLQNTHGQIRAGMVGDLVLLAADPSLDIAHTRKINAVISRGEIVR